MIQDMLVTEFTVIHIRDPYEKKNKIKKLGVYICLNNMVGGNNSAFPGIAFSCFIMDVSASKKKNYEK